MKLALAAMFAAAVLALAPHPGAKATGHRCADLFVQAQVQLAAVRGVWNCLEPPIQQMYRGSGDEALAGSALFFDGESFIGCDDGSICVYAMAFEATTAATTGVSVTTMTVWLDDRGLVAHAAIPKPIP